MSGNSELRPETIAAQSARHVEPHTGAVSPPLYLTTTYARDENYQPKLKENYQRNGSPNLWQVEETIAALEKGVAALAFASGMSATLALFDTIPKGAHVAAPARMYYGTRAWLQQMAAAGQISLTLFDPADPQALLAAITPGTDLVWLESPVNPTWETLDIAAAAQAARRAGALVAVDATALGAVACNPLTLGADFVFHSATKYFNGHSDVLAGVLVAREATERWRQMAAARTQRGTALAPFESWLLLRGLRTLFVRYREASASAMAIAKHFSAHPKIEKVLYPGLSSTPGHGIARRQCGSIFGGMMSLCLNSDEAGARAFCTRLKVIVPATSLGGCESLAEHRKTVEGPSSTLPGNLVRLSVGLESASDLIADIEQALAGL